MEGGGNRECRVREAGCSAPLPPSPHRDGEMNEKLTESYTTNSASLSSWRVERERLRALPMILIPSTFATFLQSGRMKEMAI